MCGVGVRGDRDLGRRQTVLTLAVANAASSDSSLRHRSSATPLAWVYGALIVYASLYPFMGWRIPGVTPWAFLRFPWPHWWTGFDLMANLLGYLPFGALVFGALVRTGTSVRVAWPLALLAGASLSLSLEMIQNYLPQRVASNVDLALNITGTFLGAVIALGVNAFGGVERWQAIRERWFIDRSAGGLSLLFLWPIGLLFPGPVPLALGQVLPRLRDAMAELLRDTSFYDDVAPWLLSDWGAADPLSPGAELLLVMLGFLAPCLVGFAITRSSWRRMLLIAVVAVLGIIATTLSTALNFGPDHAFAWATKVSPQGFVVGVLLALLLAWVPRRAAAGIGLMVLAALIILVAQAPRDAYFADSLKAWEQGRFIRFHGAAQWIGWLWPFAAVTYLLSRIAARKDE